MANRKPLISTACPFCWSVDSGRYHRAEKRFLCLNTECAVGARCLARVKTARRMVPSGPNNWPWEATTETEHGKFRPK